MYGKALLTGVAAFALVGAVEAADYTWNIGSGNWTDPNSWLVGGVVSGFPDGAEDRAIFPTGVTANVALDFASSQTIGELQLQGTANVTLQETSSATRKALILSTASAQSGTMIVPSGADLIIGENATLRSASAVTHQIGGEVVLANVATTGEHAILEVNANATFGPQSTNYGAVRGADAQAQILVANGVTMTNRITIEGMMELNATSGTATFVNDRSSSAYDAIVYANAGGELLLGANLALDDSRISGNRPLYIADGAGSILTFTRPQDGASGATPLLEGDFETANDGTLNFALGASGTVEVLTRGDYFGDVNDILVSCDDVFYWLDGLVFKEGDACQ